MISPRKRRKGPSPRTVSNASRVVQLRGIVQPHDSLLILIDPDPDSMASAMALKRLLWKGVHTTTIAFVGRIERLENLAMSQLLNIPMVAFDRIDPDRYTRKALVDSQPHHHETFARYRYDIVIDHHPLAEEIKASYSDIRSAYGATATILCKYLRGAGIKPSESLATALLYAIKVDTQNFERDAGEEDVKEFRYLFRYANLSLLRKIESSELRVEDLPYYQKALRGMELRRKRLFAHLGRVRRRDLCVQIAEFFLRVHGVSWIFVSGIHQGNLIVVVRNDGYRKNAGKMAEQAFGDLGSAGGHRGAARAEIPLEAIIEEMGGTSEKHILSFLHRRTGRGFIQR